MRHDPEHAEPGLVHPEVAAALGRLAELAATRQPDEGVLPEFLERYYRELPEPDLDDRRLDELYSVPSPISPSAAVDSLVRRSSG